MRTPHLRGASASFVLGLFAIAGGCGKTSETGSSEELYPTMSAGAGASGSVGTNTTGSSTSGDAASGDAASSSGSGDTVTASASSGSGGGSGTGGSGGGAMLPQPSFTPSGYLLITKERLAEMQTAVKNNDPKWLALKARVDKYLSGGTDLWHDAPENRALVYLLTKDAKYAQAAYSWAKTLVDTVDVRFDSYLDFGELMRHAALVLNWCGDALAADQRAALTSYLDGWTNELWFANKGSGWGLADPGNNYHHAFLQGTAYAGYALKQAGSSNGQKYVDLLADRLTKKGGVLEYLGAKLAGGGWREGANYGERSKQRLDDALAVVASLGGPNYFYSQPFFSQAIYFAVYQTQPDHLALDPEGDLARDSAMPVTACERDYLQTSAYWLPESEAHELARWYAEDVAPIYDNPYGGLAFKDVIFGGAGTKLAPDALPLAYFAAGTGFLNLRSGWDAAATSVTISGPPEIEQSHQHLDAGAIALFKHAWIGMDADTFSKTGLLWSPGAHNTIHVAGAQRFTGPVGGVVRRQDDGKVAYAAVDATDQYRYRPGSNVLQLMNEVTREIVYARPGTLVVYDRVDPKNAGQAYEWRMHLPVQPSQGSGQLTLAYKGTGLTLVPLVGGSISIAGDGDLEGGGSSAYRIAEAATAQVSRYLNAIGVADGNPPALAATHVASSGAMEGADTGALVAMFSKNPKGAPPSLPFSYTVPGTQQRTHFLANLGSSVDVAIVKSGGNTTVTVSQGSSYPVSSAGAVTFTQ